jgi:hypothetical protein
MSFNLGTLISGLKSSGITGSDLALAVSVVAGLSPNAKIKACLTTILANSGNPGVIADEIKQIDELSPPGGVVALMPTLAAASTPLAVVAAVQGIEAALGSGSIFG